MIASLKERGLSFSLCTPFGGLRYREHMMLVTRCFEPGKGHYHRDSESRPGNKEGQKTQKTGDSKDESISSVFLAFAITDHV